MSSHNGYLQILYQGGVVGIVLYASILVILFRRTLSLRDPRSRAIGVAALCSGMLCDLFEVVLIQNNFGIGLVFWILTTTTLAPTSSDTHGAENGAGASEGSATSSGHRVGAPEPA
jgi:O-antigen ligase